jgi:hypothetical protein
MSPVGSFLRGKASGSWIWPPPPNAELKKAWSYTFTPQYIFMAYCVIKHRNNSSVTYLRSWAPLEKPPTVQPPKNLPAFYGTRRFITVFTRALHWFLSWARSTQSTPSHPISLSYILLTFCLWKWRVQKKLLTICIQNWDNQDTKLDTWL